MEFFGVVAAASWIAGGATMFDSQWTRLDRNPSIGEQCMSVESPNGLPPNGRLVSAGMVVAATIGLLVNHFAAGSQNVVRLMILCLGPTALLLGIGGIIEPKIVWSVGKYGKDLPVVYKIIGSVLGALGVAVTILLLLFAYRLGPPR